MCFSVNKCCLCINLDVGAKIIAILNLVSCIVAFVLYCGAALSALTQSRASFYATTTAVAVLEVVICGLLVYGMFWRKARFLAPWLVMSWITCGGLLLLSLLGVVLLSLQAFDDVETTTEITTMSTFYFLYALLLYYCTLVVNSRRRQMYREEEIQVAGKLGGHTRIPNSLLV